MTGRRSCPAPELRISGGVKSQFFRKVRVMQQIFIELYNYGPAWAKCPESERTDFAKKVIVAVKGLKSAGFDVVAYGMNSSETDRRAPYDFFCVYRVPNVEFQREFERQVAASSWYDYFEQCQRRRERL
jgi:hypothetical protein